MVILEIGWLKEKKRNLMNITFKGGGTHNYIVIAIKDKKVENR
jgi:hypothetical protein